MNAIPLTIVGLGEVLWDLLPAGKQLGGAPANFAYMARLLGDQGIVASRIGGDVLGAELRDTLAKLGLETSFVQSDQKHATGTVKVEVDRDGQPIYEITESVAWDFLECNLEWQSLARQADAICFGSLAQRSPKSRETIRRFLKDARPDAVRVFDVNLRQEFYSADVIAESAKLADIIKLNDNEFPKVMQLLGLAYDDEKTSAQRLVHATGVKLVCVTRGSQGSLLVDANASDEHPGSSIRVADTVGAGDAFAAALVHHFLRGSSLAEMNEAANRMGAWVVSHVGATPPADDDVLSKVRAAKRSTPNDTH
jgi:fructokinase